MKTKIIYTYEMLTEMDTNNLNGVDFTKYAVLHFYIIHYEAFFCSCRMAKSVFFAMV